MVRRMPKRRCAALLCGSARAVLTATARGLSRAGIPQVIQASPADLADVRRLLRAAARRDTPIRVVEAGLGGDEASRRLIAAAWAAAHAIDTVVLCVGQRRAAATDLQLEEWDDAIATSLRAPFFLAKHAALRMAERGGGRLVLAVEAPARPERPAEAVVNAGLRCMVDAFSRALPPDVALGAVFGGAGETTDQGVAEIARAVGSLVIDGVRPNGTIVDLGSPRRG